jgi:hypothetical protein
MRKIRFLLYLTGGLLLVSGYVLAADPATHLYMPDGQLLSHLIRVYVTPDIPESFDPRLRLTGSHEVTEKHPKEDELIKPFVHATNQNWIEILAGQKVTKTGTLLLFDLRSYPIHPLKPMIRLTPILYRKDSENDTIWNPVAVGSKEIYLGKSTQIKNLSLSIIGSFASILPVDGLCIQGQVGWTI